MSSTSPLADAANSSIEPGSFRDRTGRIFYHNQRVLRALSPEGALAWRTLKATSFYKTWSENGSLVETHEVQEKNSVPFPGTWECTLEHHRIPFISYPYEWCFGMLKDAALLQLEILKAALAEDVILKDATPYNLQWQGAQPIFIDLLSFEPLASGQVWVGYRQFCELFLYPLMLQAYRDVPFQSFLRGELEGFSPENFWKMLSFRDTFRPGVFKHVFLHSKLQQSFSHTSTNIKESLSRAGFRKELILANVKGLIRLVRGICLNRKQTQWSNYAETCPSYSKEDFDAKVRIIEDILSTTKVSLAWDIGCNTGFFSRLAAKHADYVVGMDSDYLAVERLYQALKTEGTKNILPLVSNVAQPSPALGWRGLERKRLEERGKPDLIMALALIHHVVIGANIPLYEFIEQLALQGKSLIIEFVTRDDEMVKTLLRNKVDQYSDYSLEHFERCLGQFFEIKRREPLPSGKRVLYYAVCKKT